MSGAAARTGDYKKQKAINYSKKRKNKVCRIGEQNQLSKVTYIIVVIGKVECKNETVNGKFRV